MVPYVEELARRITLDATMRALENNRLQVRAYDAYSSSREILSNMQFSSAFPQGLIRHAQSTKIRMKTIKTPDGKNRSDPESGEFALNRFEDDPDEEANEMGRLPEIEAMYNAAKAKKDALREKRRADRASKRNQIDSAGAEGEAVPGL